MTHPGWAGLGYVARHVETNWAGVVGATVHQPKIAEVHAAVESLNRDVQQNVSTISRLGGDGFVRNWAAFDGEWRTWYRAHDSAWDLRTAWVAENPGGFGDVVRDTLLQFIDRYNRLERQYRAFGLEPSSAGSTSDPGGGGAPSGEGGPSLPPWAWALIVIGGVGVGGYLLYTISRVMREGRLIAETGGGMRGLGGRQRWAVYEIIKVPSREYEDEEELDLVRVTRPVTTRAAAMRQMRKLERETGGPGGAKYAVHGAGKGLDGLGGPKRVSDLDGPSTYNLEIER